MHNSAGGEMHYIDADLDRGEWVEAGFAKLQDYLAWWCLFGALDPGRGCPWKRPPGPRS